MEPNEPTPQQLVAELIEQFADALAIVTSAIAKQGDAEKLKADLQSRIIAAKATQTAGAVAIHLATSALAAVEAVHHENQSKKPDQHNR